MWTESKKTFCYCLTTQAIGNVQIAMEQAQQLYKEVKACYIFIFSISFFQKPLSKTTSLIFSNIFILNSISPIITRSNTSRHSSPLYFNKQTKVFSDGTTRHDPSSSTSSMSMKAHYTCHSPSCPEPRITNQTPRNGLNHPSPDLEHYREA